MQSKCIISRDTSILPRKLDWLLTERLEEVKSIMQDNDTFVSFPIVGSQASLISIYGDQRVNIERTIRSIMILVSHPATASHLVGRSLTSRLIRCANSTLRRSGCSRSRLTC